MNALLQAALDWAELEVRVAPCRGKNPGGYLGDGWQHQASADPDQVRRWWARWPRANVGIVPGRELLPVDVDRPEEFERLQRESEPAPPTPRCYTNGEPGVLRERLIFRHPGGELVDELCPGVQLRDGERVSIVPPSVNPNTGEPYEWRDAPDEVPICALPKGWLERARKRDGRRAPALGVGAASACPRSRGRQRERQGGAQEGDLSARRSPVRPLRRAAPGARAAGRMGCPEPAAARTGRDRARRQLDRRTRGGQVDGVDKLAAAQEATRNGVPAGHRRRAANAGRARGEFEDRLYLPDPGIVVVSLGAVAANHLPGDPVWLIVVGPPSSGKTEVLIAIAALPDVHRASTLTEAALLSGTPSKERAKGASGGLLHEIGEFGLIVCKDLTSILSMRHDTQAEVLGALREVYDGQYTRQVGTEGGRMLAGRARPGCSPAAPRRSTAATA